MEYVEVAELPEEDARALVRRQVARFHAYALAVAHRSGLNAQDAAQLFLSAKPEAARGPRVQTTEEFASVVMQMAVGTRAVRGAVSLGHDEHAWVLVEPASELVAQLAGWPVPVGFLEAWFAAVQSLEAADVGLESTVRLDDGQISQRLTLPDQ
jgi:hypothetical protein